MVAQADLTTVEMMEGARTVGRLVEAATRREVAVRPVAEVAVRVRTDRVADGQTTMEQDHALVAVVARPVAEGALAVREEEEAAQMRVMTVEEGVAASTPTSRKS